jgi:hypothetical protein
VSARVVDPMTSDARARVADRYRQAAFDFLLAVRRLVESAEQVNMTTVAAADPAAADIGEARTAIAEAVTIMVCDMPAVRMKRGTNGQRA